MIHECSSQDSLAGGAPNTMHDQPANRSDVVPVPFLTIVNDKLIVDFGQLEAIATAAGYKLVPVEHPAAECQCSYTHDICHCGHGRPKS